MIDVVAQFATITGLAKGGVVVAIIILTEIVIWFLRARAHVSYEALKKDVANLADIENVSLSYYRKRQMLGIVRASVWLFAILLAALLYDFQTFSVLALGLGALVIIQKENINSLIAYIFVLSNFNVGDDIRVNDLLGEIVRISPLQTTLSGKDDNGEYNGQRVSVPNYKLLLENVRVQELKSDTYRRIVLKVVYEHGEYDVPFAEFIKRTRAFLDEFLPKRNLNQVGSFKSFAGTQYKINFEYDEDGRIVIRVAFISRPHDVVDRKEHIIEFLEGMRIKVCQKKEDPERSSSQRGDA
jgi:Mechanosensitive ion channel